MDKSIDEVLTERGFEFIDSTEIGSTYEVKYFNCNIYVTALTEGGFEVVKESLAEDVPATIMKFKETDEMIEFIVKKWETK